MIEDSSEIASARVSSGYKKSMKRKKSKNTPQPISITNKSLSKISEENTDDNFDSEGCKMERKVNGCHVTFVCDDEKVTSDTSDSSKNNKGNISKRKENNKSSPGTDVFILNKNEGDRNIPWDEKDNTASEYMNKSFLLSRFVPELIDNNKITIV